MAVAELFFSGAGFWDSPPPPQVQH
ncbi:hypothetical protein AGR13a_Lc90450 [Agrobacterium genomosp. 13 str. CFBP 6927]|uniref:Uncharacterized protein n=1 Tax=Agrobacterium genomosp. 13 str. CFBP 6927 TaxID=1183428 RepID=A0ABP2BQB6_9HYPH|nr:hypothetical protein AGR13a_Lc90450 [Agrobacterium genomosp. 13 str. CFBP 6927]